MADGQTIETKVELMAKDITYLRDDVKEIKSDVKALAGIYMTREEFKAFVDADFANIKRIVYGTAALFLTAFALAIANFFLHQ